MKINSRRARPALPAFLLSLAVVGGATLTAGVPSASAAVPDSSGSSAAVARADVDTPSAECRRDYYAMVASVRSYDAAAERARRAALRVDRVEALVDQATTDRQERRAERLLRLAQLAESRSSSRAAEQQERTVRQHEAWQECETGQGTETPTDPAVPSPIQDLCDAGLPQEICDALASLPLPAPGEGGAGPLQPLCDAGLPQVLCDIIGSLPLIGGTDGSLSGLLGGMDLGSLGSGSGFDLGSLSGLLGGMDLGSLGSGSGFDLGSLSGLLGGLDLGSLGSGSSFLGGLDLGSLGSGSGFLSGLDLGSLGSGSGFDLSVLDPILEPICSMLPISIPVLCPAGP